MVSVKCKIREKGSNTLLEFTVSKKVSDPIIIIEKSGNEFVYFEEVGSENSPYYSDSEKIIAKSRNKYLILEKSPKKAIFLARANGVMLRGEFEFGQEKEDEDFEIINEIESLSRKMKGAFLAYNCNIDKTKHISKELESLGKPAKIKRLPGTIRSTDQLLACILYSMKNGALELPISNEIADTLEKIKAEETRMGGQAGIMSNFIASLGIKTFVYTPMLSEEQLSLFNNKVMLATKKSLISPPEKIIGQKKVNWIFEFSKGDKLFNAVAKENGRFIAATRPENFRISKFYSKFYNDVDIALISGIQNVKRIYKDGESCVTQVNKAEDLIKSLEKKRKTIHLELASTKDSMIRKLIIKKIIPYVNSIGLDDAELVDFLKSLDEKKISGMIEKTHSIECIFDGIVKMAEKTKVNKIHLHARGCYIAYCRHDYLSPKEIKKSLRFAAIAAAAKATGEINSFNDIYRGLKVPLSEYGLSEIKRLEKALQKKGITMKDGIIELGGNFVVIVPNRTVEHAKHVVGLGDIISASIFLSESCLSKAGSMELC